MRSTPPGSVAFVLSGGASLGAMQVGMLRALIQRDIRPDAIVATSVGAANGAFIASHAPTPSSLDELPGLWRAARRGDVFPLEPLTGLLGFLGVRRNLVPGVALKRLVARNLLHERLEDLRIPLHVVACDVLTGSEVLLSRGPLVDAVLASAAIPGVLPPVEWDGRLLIDGGVVNNTPVVVLPPPCPSDVQPMDFGHAEHLMNRAELDAHAFLAARDAGVVTLSGG